MKKIMMLFLVAFTCNAQAYTTVIPTQYSNLKWGVTGATGLEPYAYCTGLNLNAITDFATSIDPAL